MPALLHITVRPRGHHSISRQLGAVAAHEWKEHNPGGRVVERDLARTSLSFVDSEWIAGAFSPPETHTEGHKRAIAISDELISELAALDYEVPYLRFILGFMGISDVRFIQAEGTGAVMQGRVCA